MKKLDKVLYFVAMLIVLAGVNYAQRKLFEKPVIAPKPEHSIYENLKQMNNNQTVPDYSFLRQPNSFPKEMIPPAGWDSFQINEGKR